MTSVVAWLALALAVGHWIYTLYWGFWLGARVKEIKEEYGPTTEEALLLEEDPPPEVATPSEVLLERRDALALLSGDPMESGNPVCRCGHEASWHSAEGCLLCRMWRSRSEKCVLFVPRNDREPTS